MTSKKRQELRKEAQQLKPIIQIGANGLTSAVLKTITEAFNTRELLKIKINREDNQDKKVVKEIAQIIEKKIKKSEIVYIVGTTIIIYKENDNKNHK